MTTNQTKPDGNIYLAVTLGLLFLVGVIFFSWVTLPPAKRGAVPVEQQPAGGGGNAAAAVPAAVDEEAPSQQVSRGDPTAGQALFTATCASCHGPTGRGVPGLGKDMTSSDFIAGLSVDELVEFIKVGRDPSDPLNTTGVAMPAKGGNPALSEDDLYDLSAYIHGLQE